MSKLSFFLLLSLTVFSQCNKTEDKGYANNACPSLFFDVPVNKDTVIVTAKGMKISIPAGALQAGHANYARIEIKEAYNVADMLLGRLTTRAGKDILSSGGMFYVNAGDNNTRILKPISISVPTRYQQPGMNLYKGEIKTDGKIDWIDPQPLPVQTMNIGLQKGKQLYTMNCMPCHNPTTISTGPPLAFLDKRRDWKWLKKFVANNAEMISSGDRLAKCVYNYYNKTAMTAFPDLSDSELHAIFDFVNYQAGNINPASIPDFQNTLDSCDLYTAMKYKLNKNRDSLIIDNGKLVEVTNTIQSLATNNPSPANGLPENLVQASNSPSVYYEVKIQTFGWYNLDILVKNLPGFENSELIVRLTGEYSKDVSIYLVIPGEKILLNGGLLKGQSNLYGFFTDDGMIPLPQNQQAYVLAMREQNGQLFFGVADFVTALKQSTELMLKLTTKEQMNITIRKLNFDDFSLSTNGSKNASQIRKIEASIEEIEKYRPKGFNCECGIVEPDTGSVR